LSEGAAEATPGGTPPLPSGATPDSPAAAAKLFQWPTTRRRISGWTYHDPDNPGHFGLDIAAEPWDPIVAVADGKVVFADWGGGYGNLVILEHGNDWRSYYAHLTEIAVDVGQPVRQGETLGGAGTTGYSTGPHLHFELRYRDRPVDPHIYLP
jgi:murein DD-endopeptidase MepM/ murein hydrolase activator NlpD